MTLPSPSLGITLAVSVLLHVLAGETLRLPDIRVADDTERPLEVEILPPRRLPPPPPRTPPPQTKPQQATVPITQPEPLDADAPSDPTAPVGPADDNLVETPSDGEMASTDTDTGDTGTGDTGDAPATADSDETLTPALLTIDQLPRLAIMRYALIRGEGQLGEVVWRWQREGELYRIETRGAATGVAAMLFDGLFIQTSEGRISRDGLAPERYSAERTARGQFDTILFDWSANIAAIQSKGKVREVELVPGTQDPMSFLHQLPLLPSEAVSIPLVTRKQLRDYSFAAPKRVSLRQAGREVDALYYQRIGSQTEAEVWLQADPPHLPLQVRVFDRFGNKYEKRLLHMEITP